MDFCKEHAATGVLHAADQITDPMQTMAAIPVFSKRPARGEKRPAFVHSLLKPFQVGQQGYLVTVDRKSGMLSSTKPCSLTVSSLGRLCSTVSCSWIMREGALTVRSKLRRL